MSTTQSTIQPTAAPEKLGIGARFSIHPHCDDFVPVILGALEDVEAAGLTDGLVLETDDVSTYVGATGAPAEERLARYLTGVIAAAARRSDGGHVVAHVLLSRGCPGERTCDLAVTSLPTPEPVTVEATGVAATAHWSLYPLLDGGSDDGDHMAHIEAAIAAAQRRGTASAAAHYATRLSGDVADVLATAVDAWAQVGAHVPHVVSHLTVSIASPSAGPAQ
ncbi:YKOF-related Family [Georgenia satyanarayanai]|uniref:YKOF-related Family n=1 Tax=Georgenia satyanarayanai TaxID=860221 RepID=A0A2Y9AKA6_9MICO|nr:YkoF family thiamine/hydroxymethylpyrimidine-binding protein [Georgenia satyanarayanai]PYF98912.1 YKOF-related protein [Georgenia satyanarayanai]SSA44760.1 YKOF-related Family [Georgenia satyanarayanai]